MAEERCEEQELHVADDEQELHVADDEFGELVDRFD